jgi:hypothetical protein
MMINLVFSKSKSLLIEESMLKVFNSMDKVSEIKGDQ